jgi:hypothetical protein
MFRFIAELVTACALMATLTKKDKNLSPEQLASLQKFADVEARWLA